MKRWMIWAVLFLFMAVGIKPAGASPKGKIITPGDFFPEFSFSMALSRGDVEYLGLPTKFLGLMKGDTFSLKDIKGDLIVLEYMNKYCFSCQLQAPVMNQAFEMTAGKDSQLRGKVKFEFHINGRKKGNNPGDILRFQKCLWRIK